MNVYQFRVTYSFPDADTPYSTYEPVCVRATTQADAETEVDEATTRYEEASGATKTVELLLVTAEA